MKKDNIRVRWITHQRSSRVCSIEHFVSWLIELASRDSRYSKIDLIADVQRNYFYLIILTPFSIKTYPLMQTESPSFIYVMCPKKQIAWSKEEKMSLFFGKWIQHQTNIIHSRKFLLIYHIAKHLNIGLSISIWIMLFDQLTPLKWQYINQPSIDIECAFWRNFTLNYWNWLDTFFWVCSHF